MSSISEAQRAALEALAPIVDPTTYLDGGVAVALRLAHQQSRGDPPDDAPARSAAAQSDTISLRGGSSGSGTRGRHRSAAADASSAALASRTASGATSRPHAPITCTPANIATSTT